MEPPALLRTCSAGGIPVYQGSDINITNKPAVNFDNIAPEFDRLWYGPIAFEIAGQTWQLESFVNFGAEGQTYIVVNQNTGKRSAAKFCLKHDSMEIDLLKTLPRQLVVHPNFLTYDMIVLDVNENFAPANHIILMENVPNGELFELLASQESSVAGKPVSEGTMRRFLRDLIRGMAECYRFGITHRDLKPENLLINEEGTIVIIDLGHAKRGEAAPISLNRNPSSGPGDGPPPPMQPLLRTSTVNAYGTEAFNAPEVSRGAKYDCELSDIWSVGVIAFYLHGKLPAFKVAGGAGSWDDIQAEGDNERFWKRIDQSGSYPDFPDGLKQFINTMWRSDPTKRPSFSQLDMAIDGHAETIAQFPGLSWLGQPVNDPATFIEELTRSCPGKTFKLPSAAAPESMPAPVAGATRW